MLLLLLSIYSSFIFSFQNSINAISILAKDAGRRHQIEEPPHRTGTGRPPPPSSSPSPRPPSLASYHCTTYKLLLLAIYQSIYMYVCLFCFHSISTLADRDRHYIQLAAGLMFLLGSLDMHGYTCIALDGQFIYTTKNIYICNRHIIYNR
jgi:hypothetical protein